MKTKLLVFACVLLVTVGINAAGLFVPGSGTMTVTLDSTATTSDSGYVSMISNLYANRTLILHVGVRGPYNDTLGMSGLDTINLVFYSQINNVLYKVDSAPKFAIPGTYYKPIVSAVGDTLLKHDLIAKWIIRDTTSLGPGDTTDAGALLTIPRNYELYWECIVKE